MTIRTNTIALFAVLASGVAMAQAPGTGIDQRRHPNLAAAQDLIREAAGKITDAQQANGYAVGGHAAKAKRLLAEASEELKLAAVTANRK